MGQILVKVCATIIWLFMHSRKLHALCTAIFHTGIYTPRVHCMYGTLELNWHVNCQFNVQLETIDIIWIYVQVIWYKSTMCIYIFRIFSVFRRHDILILFSHWAIQFSVLLLIQFEFLTVLNEYTIPICDRSYSFTWGNMIIIRLFVGVSKQPTDLC